MRTVPFGPTGTQVPKIVAGMMPIAAIADADIRDHYTAAREGSDGAITGSARAGRGVTGASRRRSAELAAL